MAEAALKYDFEQPETLMVPDGGLATFLTATEGAWADEEPFPQNGIAQVTRIADRLAEFGRHEDEYMVHAAEGETVIPMNVLDANPRLRKNLFAQMEKMGLEPERYVVGSELNSINPVTGQPEFFLKKLFKGIKKVIKSVVKVVKKALPVVLPIVLSFTPLGPIWGAAMGSGIGTLAQGGSFKDALKSAALSAAMSGIFQGMKGGLNRAEGQTFGQGFKSGVKTAGGNIGQRFGQTFGGARPEGAPYFGAPGRAILSPDQAQAQAAAAAQAQAQAAAKALQPKDFQGRVIQDRPYTLGTEDEVTRALAAGDRLPGQQPIGPKAQARDFQGRVIKDRPYTLGTEDDLTKQLAVKAPSVPETLQKIDMSSLPDKIPTPGLPPIDMTGTASKLGEVQVNIPKRGLGTGFGQPDPEPTGWWGKTKDLYGKYISPSGQRAAAGEKAKLAFLNDVTDGGRLKATTEQLMRAAEVKAEASAGLGMIGQYGPAFALATGIGGGMGLFSPPEVEDAAKTKEELEEELRIDPAKVAALRINFPSSPIYQRGIRPSMAAQGGGIGSLESSDFPRRSGSISGPGTGRSDDVPAMLSDGEFVMTAKAVRGAGKGSRNNGMKNMYQLMRNFEGCA